MEAVEGFLPDTQGTHVRDGERPISSLTLGSSEKLSERKRRAWH